MRSYRRKDIEKMLEEDKKIKQMMAEMAMPLKVYVRKIDNCMHELVENWCLCKWCQMFDCGNINFNHWKKELCAFINQLKDPTIKHGIDKRKHLQKWLVEYYDLDDEDMICRIVNDKFDDEQILDKDQIRAVAKQFASNVSSLISIIASPELSTKQYVHQCFDA